MYNYINLDPAKCDFIMVAESSEMGDNERLMLDIEEHPIVLFRIAGNLYAIADKCSHDDNTLGDGNLDGFEIECPRHGSYFDVRTGQVKGLPAVVDIPAYPVREVNGWIEVGIPKDT
jgi:3-phenylpropionate/trans-cinnamate dioxygenase ferredoxin subunit